MSDFPYSVDVPVEASNLNLLVRLVRRHGHTEIDTLEDPRKVIEYKYQFNPDLILLDLNMRYLSEI